MENHETFIARFAKKPRGFRYTIEHAYILSKDAHRSQRRRGGGRYFEHPRAVALILFDELGVEDEDILAAGLLHDVVEDTKYLTVDFVEYLFGETVSDIVDLVTKRPGQTTEEYWARLRNTWMADAVVVKVADRVHNLRCKPGENKVRETREQLVPILADRVSRYPKNELLVRAQALLNRELERYPTCATTTAATTP